MRLPDTGTTLPKRWPRAADDRIAVAKSIGRELRQLGYPMAAVAFLEREALRIAVEGCSDLALMEIRLRAGMDGIETTAKTRSR